jgi:hypothetical protein
LAAALCAQAFDLAERENPDQGNAELGDDVRRPACRDARSVVPGERPRAILNHQPLRATGIDAGEVPGQLTGAPQVAP